MALDGNEGLPPSNGAATVITNGHGKGVAAAHQYPPSTPHLNPHNLLILSHQSRGRGVYASQSLSAGTLLDISPVLVFEPQEWAQHGSKTILDSYTFKWGGMGQMALALGLGSLFNHSPHPSVSFSLDRPTHSIRYTLVRDVVAGEELCISYGPWGRQYESNGSTDSDAAAEETDEEQRCCRDLDDMLRIGQDRADSGAESSEASGSSPRRRNTAPRRRTRTRYTAGSASNPSSAATMQATKDQQQDGNAAQQQQPIRRPMPRIATPPARASPPLPPTAASSSSVADHPIWRLTSLPDPATVPLTLIPCWALVIDPHASSQVLPFLRRHSRQLGRGPSLGGEGDPLRHAKTLSRKPEDEGKLRALVCPRAALPDQDAVRELARGAFASYVDVVPVDVASSVAPLKERAAEWSASWPVAFRSSQVAAPVAAPASNGNSSSGTDSPSPAVAPPPPSPQPPSLFVDRRADCAFWSAARTQWVVRKLARCVLTAMSAKEAGEVPVAVHICPSILASPHFTTGGEGSGNAGSPAPAPLAMSAAATTAAGWDADGLPLEGGEAIEVDAHDSRISQRNPIKHAVGNAVRSVAEIRAERRAAHDERASGVGGVGGGATGETTPSAAVDLASSSSTRPPLPGALTTTTTATATSSPQSSRPDSPFSTASSITAPPSAAPTYQPPLLNGQDYLLTSLTLFTTHEPCIYCSMSLVHSRVRHVVLLTPSPKGSGGCCGSQLPASRRCAEDGGPYALHEQRGLNHRFEVWRWRGGKGLIEEEVKRMSGKSVDVERLLDLGEWGKAIDP